MPVTRSVTAARAAEVAGSVFCSELLERIASFLPQNEMACTFRLISKDAAHWFSDPQHCTIRASQPLPPWAYRSGAAKTAPVLDMTLKARRAMVYAAVATGLLECVEAAADAAGLALTVEVFEAACAAGQLQLCKQLAAKGWLGRCGVSLAHGADGGRQAVCAWLLSTGRAEWSPDAVYAALQGGHLALAEWLMARCPPEAAAEAPSEGAFPDVFRGSSKRLSPFEALAAAAEGCGVEQLQRLWPLLLAPVGAGGAPAPEPGVWAPARQQPQQPSQGGGQDEGEGGRGAATFRYRNELATMLNDALRSPTPCWRDKALFLVEQGAEKRGNAYYYAIVFAGAKADLVGRLRWLRDNGWPLPGPVIDIGPFILWPAVSHGRLDVVQCLVEELGVEPAAWEGPSGDDNLPAGTDVLPALQYLHQRGYNGGGGNGGPYQWARLAGELGSVAVLEWMERVGFGMFEHEAAGQHDAGERREYYSLLVEGALQTGHAAVVEWALERDAGAMPPPADVTEWCCPVSAAARLGLATRLEDLSERGYVGPQVQEAYADAADNADMLILRTLWRLGCGAGPPGSSLMRAVGPLVGPYGPLWNRDSVPLPVLRWLAEHTGLPQSEEQWTEAESRAGTRKHHREEVVAWLQREREVWRRSMQQRQQVQGRQRRGSNKAGGSSGKGG